MTRLPSRGISLVALVVVGLFAFSLTSAGANMGSLVYRGYMLAIPVVFAIFILASVYFGVRHLLTA
jgi:hypothetical protein